MRPFDYNLIAVFTTLYETGSVTQSAERLFVTQPSVSYALGKLREHFDDVLFVRSSQGMQPTRLAIQLYPGLKEASRCIDSAVADAKEFEPFNSTRRFKLALSDIGEMAFLPLIISQFNTLAPNVELEIVPLEIESAGVWLSDGHIDAAICSRALAGANIQSKSLISERYVCLLDTAHPRIGSTISIDQFSNEPHALVTRTSGHGMAEDALLKLGIHRRIKLKLPHFSALPKIIPGTELLAILPNRVAESFCEMSPGSKLKILELPFHVPGFDVILHWHSRSEQSAALSWFITQVQQAMTE